MPIYVVYSGNSMTILEADSGDKALDYIQGLAGSIIKFMVRDATDADLARYKDCELEIPSMPFPLKARKTEEIEPESQKFTAVETTQKSASG